MCLNRCIHESTGAHVASSYMVTQDKLTIDGEQFPWHIEAGGPRVESVGADDWAHILWVPILVETPMIPETTDKPGQPVCTDHNPVQHRDEQPPWCKNCKEE